MPLLDMDDEFTTNQATAKGQLLYPAAGTPVIASRVKDAQSGWPGPAAAAATFGTAAAPLAFRRRDWAAGELVVPYFAVTPVAAYNVGTSLQIDIIAADNADLVTTMTTFNGVSLTRAPVVLSTITVLTAALLAGTIFAMPPLTPGTIRRYLGAKATAVGATATTGALVIGLIQKDARPQDSVVFM